MKSYDWLQPFQWLSLKLSAAFVFVRDFAVMLPIRLVWAGHAVSAIYKHHQLQAVDILIHVHVMSHPDWMRPNLFRTQKMDDSAVFQCKSGIKPNETNKNLMKRWNSNEKRVLIEIVRFHDEKRDTLRIKYCFH